jgi:hypothetical protein
MLFLLFVLHNFKNDEKGNAFSFFSAFWELGRLTPPMGERWDEGGGKMGQLPKSRKSRKSIVFFLILEIQKQKKQKKHCLFCVLWDTNIEILKKALSFLCFMEH